MTLLIFFAVFLTNIQERIIPPGTIQVGDIYVDQNEVLNLHYIEFLYYKKLELEPNEYDKLVPVETQVQNGILIRHELPANRYKPVVGITYKQASEYSKWRSEFVSKKLGKEIKYRLPSIEEWNEIAQFVIDSYPNKVEKEIKKAKKAILKHDSELLIFESKASRKKSRSPNEYNLKGIYNYFDSVSEMTSEVGIAKGANNSDLVDLQENLNRIINYDSANVYIGFRCVADMEF